MTHYYPFGMEMPALGYQAGGLSKNRYLYNQGTGEVTFDTERIPELNIDMTHFRAYDPTLGRWWQVDPMADEMSSWSPYNYSFNNPIRFNDPLGDQPSATFNMGQTAYTIGGKEQSEDWIEEQRTMYSNGGGGIQKYLPSNPPTSKEGQKQEEEVKKESNDIKQGNETADQWSATKAAFGIAVATSSADGPLLIGEAIGLGVIVGAAAADLYKQQPNGTQYTLRAKTTGLYQVYSWGSAIPTGTKYLNAGDIWKIGETIQFDSSTGHQSRYSQSYLEAKKVSFVSEYLGPKSQIVFVQQMKLAQYLFSNGTLPAGNKGLK